MTSLRPVWLYGWVFLYEPSGCEFESHWSHLSYWDIVPVLSKEVSGNFSDLIQNIQNTVTNIGWVKWLTSVTSMMAQSWPWDRQIADKKSLNVYEWQDKKFILENSLHTTDFTDFILEFIWKRVWCCQRTNSRQHQPISVNSIQQVINVIIIELIPGNFQLCQSINSK